MPEGFTCVASFVLITNTMKERYFSCPHFADEDTEAQNKYLSQSHTDHKQQSQNLNLGGIAPAQC